MRIYIMCLPFLLLSMMAWANSVPKYNISKLDDKLRVNADAVTRLEEETFKVKAIDEAKLEVHRAITILNQHGDNFAPLYISYDPQRKVKNISCTIYDAKGEVIKKVKKNEMEDFSSNASYSLYDDNRMIYYMYNSHQYPYTIEYSYEIEFDGLFYYPDWDPVGADQHAVEKSVFSITTPKDISYRYKVNNIHEDPVISTSDEVQTSTWTLENFAALKKEPLSPEFSQLVPTVYFAPNDFEFEGYAGNMESWENFGLWVKKLNAGKDILPEATQDEVLKLINHVDDKREQIRLIYEYMQSKTRYVSIQLGIGGYQPFDAITVDNVGYGDCKALTNYTKALLKTAGIDSYYTLIRAGAQASPIFKDFPSTQFNHAILCVPIENDTIWLECTDQKIPFGYLGYFTSDRDVLIIDEDGGKIGRTKSYHRDENLQIRSAVVSLAEEGHGKAEVLTTYQGLQYDHISSILEVTASEQEMIIYQKTSIPNFTLNQYQYIKNAEGKASIKEKLEISLEKYAQSSNSRLFFTPNLLNQLDGTPPDLKDRMHDVVTTKAFVDTDTITYLIPENMHPEYIPESSIIVSDFGEYSITFKEEQGKIVYTRTFKANKGNFPSSSYAELVEFYERVAQKDAQKIVLKKST
ncbi:hypothetical protein OKW21_001885 [Catalinimonas alkaloidigena]|uniref:DUF3857 domain-containing protein n=1 Tax=Catalinimonas alkaloidigena TaxID=1075417 RepID=UPI0024075A3E|nr:DUF3857 domain-containing protein [Catalinimonas alkaloidigena]MDF9796622.1 hypothetical protein [Catalinimonas alkaloidigena]